jgi:hypothetical protein
MIKEMKGEDGFLVWKIDKTINIYEYYFNPKGAQEKTVSKITFTNRTKKPGGLNNNGYGFGRHLKPLYYLLKEHFTKIDEIVIGNHDSGIKRKIVNFNAKEYDLMVDSLSAIYRENASRLKDATLKEMSNIFPRRFKSKDKTPVYEAGTLSRILSKKGVVESLDLEDINKVAEIFPKLIDRSAKAKANILSKIRFTDIRNKTTKFELKRIIDEYTNLLNKKTQKESEWQSFFKKNILFFNSSYIQLIDKKNISTDVSIPDFMLIDQFQFIDVFEIKKPDFDCLKYDPSHDNYYWSKETSAAIAQVEKYLFQLENNASQLIVSFQKKGIGVNIIRPRGYVLISKREMLDKNGQDSFRILNNALKNVQVIFFDDFLISLKNKYTFIAKK